MGFYCALHGYQKPRALPDGGVSADAAHEDHLRRRTSFLAPEHGVAAEMAKSPGLVRDREGAPRSAAGAAIMQWLRERKALAPDAARAYAGRMMELGILVPLGGMRSNAAFSEDKAAFYKIVPKLPGAAPP